MLYQFRQSQILPPGPIIVTLESLLFSDPVHSSGRYKMVKISELIYFLFDDLALKDLKLSQPWHPQQSGPVAPQLPHGRPCSSKQRVLCVGSREEEVFCGWVAVEPA